MRFTPSVIFCAVIALQFVGCSPVDRAYVRGGVGTEIYALDTAEATAVETSYVSHICEQAGLGVADRGCAVSDWDGFVQAGMNDIDRRCDAYLNWLDDRKRSRGPILKQIADTAAATSGIMRIAGAGADPIAIAGLAFGFAASTFTNLESRLITEIEQSTVQAVVLSRQRQFRETLPKTINNRPAAIYALRSYLRLCMPMTIETQINTTIKLYERGGLAALADSQAKPMIDARTVRTAIITDIRTPLPRLAKPNVVNSAGLNEFERSLSPGKISEYQNALCVPQTKILDKATRTAINDYLAARKEEPVQSLTRRTGDLIFEAVDRVRGSCTASGFQNATDVGKSFSNP